MGANSAGAVAWKVLSTAEGSLGSVRVMGCPAQDEHVRPFPEWRTQNPESSAQRKDSRQDCPELCCSKEANPS